MLHIIDATGTTWRSPVYDHYNTSLERHLDALGHPMRLVVRFECKYREPSHSPLLRDRLRTGDGTQNLLVSARACEQRRGVTTDHSPSNPTNGLEYSPAAHRAILAIRCARDRRSFDSVVDDLHRQEVELLHPGTRLPCSVTVSNDVRHIYEDASDAVARYIQVCSN